MRIIAGHARGRRLHAPKGNDTRPTPDRVKESLFSALQGRLEGAYVLDLFAGTGALGLEAHSRGAAHVTLVERAKEALEAIARNVAAVAQEGVEVLALDAQRAIVKLARGERRYDLVFLDPPYAKELLTPTLVALAASGLMREGGVVACEHHGRASPPAAPRGLVLAKTRVFGDVAISYFEVHEDA